MDSLDLYDEMLCESSDSKLKPNKPQPEEESIDMYSEFDAGSSAQDHEANNELETDLIPFKTPRTQEEESMDMYSDFVIKSNRDQTCDSSSSLRPSKPPPPEESLDLYSDLVKMGTDHTSGHTLKPSKPLPAEESVDLYSDFVNVKSEHGRGQTGPCNVKVEVSSAPPGKDKGEPEVNLDLFTEVLTDELQHKHDSHVELAKKLTAAESRIKEVETELKESREKQQKCEAESVVIKKNMSSLLLTARNELRRKDNEIRRLNLVLAKRKVNNFGLKQDTSQHLNEMSPSHRNQRKDRRNPNTPTSFQQDSDSESIKRKRTEATDQGTPKRQRVDLERPSRTTDIKDRKFGSDSRKEKKLSSLNSERDRSANNSGRNDSKQKYTSERKDSGSRSNRKDSESRSSFEKVHGSRSSSERGHGSRSSSEKGHGSRSSSERVLESRSSSERGQVRRSSVEKSIRSRSSVERSIGSRSSEERGLGSSDRVGEKKARLTTEENDTKSNRRHDRDRNCSKQSESDRGKKESREKGSERKKHEESSQKNKKKTCVLDLREKLKKKRSGEKDNSEEPEVGNKALPDCHMNEVKQTTTKGLERKNENKDLESIMETSEDVTEVESKNQATNEKIDKSHELNKELKKHMESQTKVGSDVENLKSEDVSKELSENCKTEPSGSMAVVDTFQKSTHTSPENVKTLDGNLVDQCNNHTPVDVKAKRRIKTIMLSAKKTDSADNIKEQSCLDSVIENIERRESFEFAQAKVVHVDNSLESSNSAFSLTSKSPDVYSSKSSVLESVSFTCRSNLGPDKSEKVSVNSKSSDSLPSLCVSKHLSSESSEMILKSHSGCGTHKSDSFSKYSDISSIAPSESASSHVQRRDQFKPGTQYSVENEHFLLCTANPFPSTSSTCLSSVSTEGKPDSVDSNISDRECSLGFIMEDESCSRTIPYSCNRRKVKNSENKVDESVLKSGKTSKKKKNIEKEKDSIETNAPEKQQSDVLDNHEFKSSLTSKHDSNLCIRTVLKSEKGISDLPNGLIQRENLLKEPFSAKPKEIPIAKRLPCDKDSSLTCDKLENCNPVCRENFPCIDCRLNGHERPPYHVEPIEFTGFPEYYAKSESEDDDRLVINMPSTLDTDGQSSDMDTGTETVICKDHRHENVEISPKGTFQNAILKPKFPINDKFENLENSSGFSTSLNPVDPNIPLNRNSDEQELPKSLDKDLDGKMLKTYGRQMSMPETSSKNLIRARSSSESTEGNLPIVPERPCSTPLQVYKAIDLSVNAAAGNKPERRSSTPAMSEFSVSTDGALDLSRKPAFTESSQPVKARHLKKEPFVSKTRDEAISTSSTSGFKLYRPPIVPQRNQSEEMEMEGEIMINAVKPQSKSISEMDSSHMNNQEITTKRDEKNFKNNQIKENNERIILTTSNTLKKEPSDVDSKETEMDVDVDVEDNSSDNESYPSQKNSSSSHTSTKTSSTRQSGISTSPGKDSNHSASESESENNPSVSPKSLSNSQVSFSVSVITSGSQESQHSQGSFRSEEPSSSQASSKCDRDSSSRSSPKSDKTSCSQASSKSDKQSTSSQECSKSNNTSTSGQTEKSSSSQESSKTEQDSTSSHVSLNKGSLRTSCHSSSSDEDSEDDKGDTCSENSNVCVTDDEDLDCESSQSQLLVKSLSTRNIPCSSRSFDIVQDLQISDDSSISCMESPDSLLVSKTTSGIFIEEPDFKFPDMSKSSFGKSPKSPKLSKVISPEAPRKLSFPQDENTVLSILADSCDGFDCEPDDHKEDCRKHIPESAAEPDPEVKDEELSCAKGGDHSDNESEDSENCAEDGEITDEEGPKKSSKGPVVHDEETQELMELLKAKKLLEEKILGICSRSENNSSDDQPGRQSNKSKGQKDRKATQSSRDGHRGDRYTREIHRSDPRLNMSSRHNIRDKDEPRHRTYSPSSRHQDRRHRERDSSPAGRRDSSRDHNHRREHDRRERYPRDDESDRKGRRGHSSHRRSRDVR